MARRATGACPRAPQGDRRGLRRHHDRRVRDPGTELLRRTPSIRPLVVPTTAGLRPDARAPRTCLRANDFRVFICTGGGRDFVRLDLRRDVRRAARERHRIRDDARVPRRCGPSNDGCGAAHRRRPRQAGAHLDAHRTEPGGRGRQRMGAFGSTTMSPLAASPSLFLKYARTASVTPTRRASVGPRVEVPRVPTDVRHVVDARGATEHLPARDRSCGRRGDRRPAPPASAVYIQSVSGVELQRRARDRHRLDGWGRSSRFDKRDRARGILGESPAITAPADPPPTTTKSNTCSMASTVLVGADGPPGSRNATW